MLNCKSIKDYSSNIDGCLFHGLAIEHSIKQQKDTILKG